VACKRGETYLPTYLHTYLPTYLPTLHALMTVQYTETGIESLMLAVYKLAANKINLIIYGKEVI
jgi:hypothetical protein